MAAPTEGAFIYVHQNGTMALITFHAVASATSYTLNYTEAGGTTVDLPDAFTVPSSDPTLWIAGVFGPFAGVVDFNVDRVKPPFAV